MANIRLETKDEARKRYKQVMVFNLLQAARVAAYGSYTEKGCNTLISHGDRKQYIEYFQNEAFTAAMSLLREETFEIDCTVEDEAA